MGATAIGQGKVQASALQMASVAATIANRGVRATPTLALGERSPRTRVTTAEIAATVRRLMVGVVKFGTGTAADISGVAVAGKTGTAELGNTTDDERGHRAGHRRLVRRLRPRPLTAPGGGGGHVPGRRRRGVGGAGGAGGAGLGAYDRLTITCLSSV